MNKFFKGIEIIWLIVCMVSIGFSVYAAIQKDLAQAGYFLIFTFIAAAMYSYRKKQRKSMEE